MEALPAAANGMLWFYTAWGPECTPSLTQISVYTCGLECSLDPRTQAVWGAGGPMNVAPCMTGFSGLAVAPGPGRGKQLQQGNESTGPTSAHSWKEA